MFGSLRRWTGQPAPQDELPIDATLAAMDPAGVAFGLLSAWQGPDGVLISNEDGHGWATSHPDRFAA